MINTIVNLIKSNEKAAAKKIFLKHYNGWFLTFSRELSEYTYNNQENLQHDNADIDALIKKDRKVYQKIFKMVASTPFVSEISQLLPAFPEHCLEDYLFSLKDLSIDLFSINSNKKTLFSEIINNLPNYKTIKKFIEEQPVEKIQALFLTQSSEHFFDFLLKKNQNIFHFQPIFSALNTENIKQSNQYHNLFVTSNPFSNALYQLSEHAFNNFIQQEKEFIGDKKDIIISNYIINNLANKKNSISNKLYTLANTMIKNKQFKPEFEKVDVFSCYNESILSLGYFEYGLVNTKIDSLSYELLKEILTLKLDTFNFNSLNTFNLKFYTLYERFLCTNLTKDNYLNQDMPERVVKLQQIIEESKKLQEIGVELCISNKSTIENFNKMFEDIINPEKHYSYNGVFIDEDVKNLCYQLNLPHQIVQPLVEFLDKRYNYNENKVNIEEKSLQELREEWKKLVSQITVLSAPVVDEKTNVKNKI